MNVLPSADRTRLDANSPTSQTGVPMLGDGDVIASIPNWFHECLGCAPGQREFKLGRYVYGLIRRVDDATILLNEFKKKTDTFLATGCLMVFPEMKETSGSLSGCQAILLEVGAIVAVALGLEPAVIDGAGRALTATLRIRCPITNQTVAFDDFDAIAFLPPAGNPESPLYDPNIEAPFVCVNFTSDLYGFSMFTRDRALRLDGCEVWEVKDSARRELLFREAGQLWQRLALKTIKNFAVRTQPERLCPIHTSPDQRHWFAMHEDAAFGEMEKHLHKHEMPVIYTQRIIERWLDFYKTGRSPNILGLAPKGKRCS